MFALRGEDSHELLVHTKTMTSPLFVHSRCHDDLSVRLGFQAVAINARRRLKLFDGSLSGSIAQQLLQLRKLRWKRSVQEEDQEG
jgi:hypothetical protein